MGRERTRRRFRSRCEAATERLGEELGRRLPRGALVALDGELGSGKTTFVRGLARGLGVRETPTSPSFVLMQEYRGRMPFYHFDAWMAGREALFLQGGGAEYLESDGVAAVEWGARIESFLPRPRIAVRFAHQAANEREVELEVLGIAEPDAPKPRAAALNQALLAALEALCGSEGLEEL